MIKRGNMTFKMLGGILLIVGTSIGGGMLALPMITAKAGFLGAIALLFFSWAVMTYSAFLILEVNLWLPMNSNIILMTKKILGPFGAGIAWICYLLLFYCLLAAYMAGGSDLLSDVLSVTGIHFSATSNCILFAAILIAIVFMGVRSIDYFNRFFMFIKMTAFTLLILCIAPHLRIERFIAFHPAFLFSAISIVMTSFGFATIIPSLRAYFANDIKKLRKVIFIGSIIPLITYILWVAAIFGSIPAHGKHSLSSIVNSDHSTLALTQSLIFHLQNLSITTFMRIFTSVCVMTSFLGVSLCLVDFFADGLNIEKKGIGKLFLHVITFLPPLLIAIWYPAAFIIGLDYAGICLAVLIILLPALMTWRGRYNKNISASYRVIGGKLPLVFIMCVALIMIGQGIYLL